MRANRVPDILMRASISAAFIAVFAIAMIIGMKIERKYHKCLVGESSKASVEAKVD